MHAAGQWSMDDINDTLFNAAPNVQQAATRNIAVTSSDASSTQKIQIHMRFNWFNLQIYDTVL